MQWSDHLDRELMRIRILLGLMLLGLVFLGGVLWRIQVFRSSHYSDSLERQSMRRVRLPASRGAILDRHGVCLADNRASYGLAVYVEELRRPGKMERTVNEIERVLERLSVVTGQAPSVTRADIWSHMRRRLPLPFLAYRDIDPIMMARWAEQGEGLAGVDVHVESVRHYPMGPMAAHVLGYVGRWDPEEERDEPYHFYIPDMEGAMGVERAYDDWLSGIAGGRLIRVDASGFKYAERHERIPVAGRDLTLTIDFQIARIVEEALSGLRGAAVVLDPRNGDVLAMASAPGFDPNGFGPGMKRSAWVELNSDTNRPLFNRALAGTYPPGSTFKPVVALAALESGAATEHTPFTCIGHVDIGRARFRCWQTSGHGTIEMRKAVEQSCNAYFCQLGMATGHDRIVQMARALGLGRPAGVGLGGESSGLVPDAAWKLRRYRDAWRAGDTCNMSIGQGALLATPLQMAVLSAALANGGTVFKPRLVVRGGEAGEVVKRMTWSAEALRVVRGGMRDVIQAPMGTGKRAFVQGMEAAGKTGTAEYGPRSDRRKYTWMLAFAPYDDPRYVIAMVVEEGDSGGLTTAPRVGQVLRGLLAMEQAPPVPGEARGG